MLTIKFVLLVLAIDFGYFLGYLFTETKFRLAKYDIFKFKAFECRKCLSFHIAWVSSTFFSLLFEDWIMLLIGLFFAGMLYLGLYIDEKQRTVTL